MRRDPRAFLWDMQQAARRIASFVQGHELADYLASDLVRSGVERQFEIIGEAMTQLAKLAPDVAAAVPHQREIIAFRNVLIHGYATIDDGRVWRAAHSDLPALLSVVDALLGTPDWL